MRLEDTPEETVGFVSADLTVDDVLTSVASVESTDGCIIPHSIADQTEFMLRRIRTARGQ